MNPDEPDEYQIMADRVRKNNQLESAVKKAVEGLHAVQSQYPEYPFVLTHMDEVFNHGRLPLYIAIAELVRKHSDWPLYVTYHTQKGTKPLRDSIDPYVDIRNLHGYSFEQWLSRGHTVEEYKQDLRESGDEAWQYHNPGWSFNSPKWQRLINGLYMWDVPLSARVDFIYHSIAGNPLNDLDGSHHDYGYAFPLPGEEHRIITTRHWEAWREGIEDLWYLHTLEQLIEQSPQSQEAQDARQWLQELRDSYPNYHDTEAGGWSTPSQSPIILAMDRKYSAEDLRNIRYQAAQWIIKLKNQ
jgi:hypothetical protein